METDLGAHLDIGLGAALPAYLARCAQDAVRSLRDVDRYQRLLLADEPPWREHGNRAAMGEARGTARLPPARRGDPRGRGGTRDVA